jgi:lipid II:glycine glycyltransferase (peptidoglycan interpeptide bridge formation enzyme)
MNFRVYEASEIAQLLAATAQALQIDIFQTIPWAEISTAKGWGGPLGFSVETENQVQVLGLGFINNSKFFGDYLYLQHGPLIISATKTEQTTDNWGDLALGENAEAAKLWLTELQSWASNRGLFAIVAEPLANENSELGKLFYAHGYEQQPRSILPKYPLFMDLRLSAEQLLAATSKNTRYYINYARRKGVSISFHYPDEGNQPLEVFLELMKSAAKRKQFSLPTVRFFTAAWERYRGSKSLLIAIAHFEGKPISANFTQLHGDWAGSYYTANSLHNQNSRASYLLKWETILEAQRQGAKLFDMWGYIPDLKPGDSEYGYGQFKLGFNPIPKVFCGRVILPVKKFTYLAWKLVGELRYKFNG